MYGLGTTSVGGLLFSKVFTCTDSLKETFRFGVEGMGGIFTGLGVWGI
jgi:hypothetical protein